MKKTVDDILEYDRLHVWHPYTSMTDPLPVYPVKSAQGVYIELEDGRRLIEGMSSWWCAVHGYNHPKLNDAVTHQIKDMSHVMFGGLTHRPAVELAARLVDITPEGLEKVFYSDSGSVAVEVAIKMALQYWVAKGDNKKCQILTVSGGYHGDTWHAMSVCDPIGGMHSLYSDRLPQQIFTPKPQTSFYDKWDSQDIEQVRKEIESNHSKIAAVIIEPIVQGAGGMRFYHTEYLRELYKLCKENDILLIADEIATGFGRSGKMFACEWAGITPDIMCLGKALTGGYMSFAATMTTENVATTISSSFPGVFMHGPTFMGNPLAASVACASLDMLIENSPLARIKEIETILKQKLEPARELDNVEDVRVLGAIGVIELKEPVKDMALIQSQLVDRGIWLRPFGKLLYTMPAYVIKDHELEFLAEKMVEVAALQ